MAYDLPAEISDECIGKVAFEMVVTVARIIGITYSSIYNVLMGNAETVSNNASLPPDDDYSSLSSSENLQNDPLIGKTINGKYLVISLIGGGALTYVYLVKDLALNTAWAMKAITSKTSGNKNAVIYNSVLAEANIMKRLNHPAFPKIVDLVENNDGIFLIMEYIEGNTLKEIVAEYGIQSAEQVVDWSKQICDALRYLHSCKPPYIYRDMKPGNVIVRPNGAIAIVDFGIARTYKVGQSEGTCALGTRGYAAVDPGDLIFGERVDLVVARTDHDERVGGDRRHVDVFSAFFYVRQGLCVRLISDDDVNLFVAECLVCVRGCSRKGDERVDLGSRSSDGGRRYRLGEILG